MNILCIYPGMDKRTNDNAYMLIRLKEKGANLAIITGRSMGLKGQGGLPDYEDMDGIPIYRLYRDLQEMFLSPGKAIRKVLEIADRLKPDVIFCSQELNMRLALLIQKTVKKPIVLLVEDAGIIASGQAYRSLKMRAALRFFNIPQAPKFWTWLCQKSSAIITCNPSDMSKIDKLCSIKPLYYLPWPSYLPTGLQIGTQKKQYQGVYIGSLYPFKNIVEFQTTIPMILEKTPTKQFVIVGTGPDIEVIQRLKLKYGERIIHIDHLSRNEALELISNSHYAYTPVQSGKGWGFIGDCWSVKTPVVMTHDDLYVKNGENALVSKDNEGLIQNINTLYGDENIYEKLQSSGYYEYENRKAPMIGDKLYIILSSVA
jgi:glycosyltransferase involved in cell wall biosynthesis